MSVKRSSRSSESSSTQSGGWGASTPPLVTYRTFCELWPARADSTARQFRSLHSVRIADRAVAPARILRFREPADRSTNANPGEVVPASQARRALDWIGRVDERRLLLLIHIPKVANRAWRPSLRNTSSCVRKFAEPCSVSVHSTRAASGSPNFATGSLRSARSLTAQT